MHIRSAQLKMELRYRTSVACTFPYVQIKGHRSSARCPPHCVATRTTETTTFLASQEQNNIQFAYLWVSIARFHGGRIHNIPIDFGTILQDPFQASSENLAPLNIGQHVVPSRTSIMAGTRALLVGCWWHFVYCIGEIPLSDVQNQTEAQKASRQWNSELTRTRSECSFHTLTD